MARSEIVHVAISPPVKLEENLIKKVAAIIDKDLYETRLRLAGKIPSVVSQNTLYNKNCGKRFSLTWLIVKLN